MKIITISLIFTLFSALSFSQTVVMEETPVLDTVQKTFGPNCKNYIYSYTGYGVIGGPFEGDGAELKPGLSGGFVFGFRYKRKIAEWFSIGAGIGYGGSNFHLVQNNNKTLPDTVLHQSEKISNNSLFTHAFMRINYTSRGNTLGKFIDLGGYFQYIYTSKHITKDNEGNLVPAWAKKSLNTNYSPIWVNTMNYGATVRFGFNKIALFAKYRLSNIINDNYVVNDLPVLYPELPRYFLGLEWTVSK